MNDHDIAEQASVIHSLAETAKMALQVATEGPHQDHKSQESWQEFSVSCLAAATKIVQP